MDSLYTIAEEICSFWTTALATPLGNRSVMAAFPDERLYDGSSREYPAASVQLLPPSIDSDARVSGDKIRDDQPDGETTLRRHRPSPILLPWQLDTFAEKQSQDWEMMQIVMSQLGSRQAYVDTPAGQRVYMEPGLQANGDELEDHTLFRKIYRFVTTVWFDDPRAAVTEYLVLTRRFLINADTHEITAEAGG